MQRSKSFSGHEFTRTRQVGVYSLDYRRDENIFVLTEKPLATELLEMARNNNGLGSYLFIKDTFRAYYLDPNGSLQELPILPEDVQKLIEYPPASSAMDNGVELYLLAEAMPENPVDYVLKYDAGIKAKGASVRQYAYLFTGDKLYFVDKAEHRYVEVNDAQKIAVLKKQLEKEMPEPPDLVKLNPKLTSVQLSFLPDHEENLRKVKDEMRPVQTSLDKQKIESIYHLINGCPGHTHGEYGIYKTVVESRDYPVGRGELIKSMYGDDDELSFTDKIDKSLYEKLGDEKNRAKTTSRLLKQTVLNPGFSLDILTRIGISLIEKFAHHGHGHVSGGGLGAAAAQYALRKEVHQNVQIKPRLEMEFNLHDRIPVDELQHRSAGGSDVDRSLASGGIPTRANVWLVSSVDPRVIAETGFLSEADGSTFVCFSEHDAEDLVENLKELRQFNLEMLALQPFKLNQHCEDKALDGRISVELMKYLLIILEVTQVVLGEYVQKHQDKDDVIKPILGLELSSVTKLVRSLTTALSHDPESPAFGAHVGVINDEVAALMAGLQDYVRAHPYKAPEHAFPSVLLHHFLNYDKMITKVIALRIAQAKAVAEHRPIASVEEHGFFSRSPTVDPKYKSAVPTLERPDSPSQAKL